MLSILNALKAGNKLEIRKQTNKKSLEIINQNKRKDSLTFWRDEAGLSVALVQMKLFELWSATRSAKHADFKETQIVIARETNGNVRVSTRRMPQRVHDVEILAYAQSSRSLLK